MERYGLYRSPSLDSSAWSRVTADMPQETPMLAFAPIEGREREKLQLLSYGALFGSDVEDIETQSSWMSRWVSFLFSRCVTTFYLPWISGLLAFHFVFLLIF